ncbi:ABC transporter, putative [Hondaea fermentalgiana]|uniref:ABC transporter, putative n=1 Tax=Hondaea fermentalgiana TaxID=2315210 RepID=A0A2R5GMI0_9STRA|nr:ABC transporter, putative [Hondaea fermentalgiana]|eukprot:GBG31509.1 ABC transporter, putative [Hondaea fermentalgiana]
MAEASARTRPPRGGAYLATFAWVTPLVRTGFKRQLQAEDLWELRDGEAVRELRETFWANVKARRSRIESWRQLMYEIVRLSASEVAASGVFMLFYTAAQLANPILLRELVSRIEDGAFEGLYFAIALLLSSIVSAFSSQLQFHYSFAAGRKSRAIFISLVFEHMLKLSSAEMSGVSSGEILNMMSADAQKFFEVAQFMHLFWAGPLQIVVAISFLVTVLGLPALAGILVLFLIGPINIFMARLKRKVRQTHMPIMDARVRLCVEVLAGIRVVKLFSWESPFMKKIRAAREHQLVYVFRELYLFALVITVLIITPTTASMSTFVTYGATGHILTAADTFSALAFFNVLRFPLMQISQALMMGAQTFVATERLFRFIFLSQRPNDDGEHGAVPGARSSQSVPSKSGPSATTSFVSGGSSGGAKGTGQGIGTQADMRTSKVEGVDPASALDLPNVSVDVKDDGDSATSTALIEMHDASFSWTSQSPTGLEASATVAAEQPQDQLEVIRDVSLQILPGQLTAIVGPVGGGKSSLVSAILGELALVSGSQRRKDNISIAYCSQAPWIFNATVEENITFGKPFEEQRFRDVLQACCLWSDLEQLHEREKTVIGERGVTLSGGQKARLSLARAAYADPDVIVLDDPLSALDSHVGKLVFERLLAPRTGLLRKSARVLVTHAAQNLGACDRVLVLFRGRIAYQGAYSELQALHDDAERETDDDDNASGSNGSAQAPHSAQLSSVMESILLTTQTGQAAARLETGESSVYGREDDDGYNEHARQASSMSPEASKTLFAQDYTSAKLMTEEERKQGTIDRHVAHRYIMAAGGYPWMFFVIFLLCMERLTYLASDWWLATWADAAYGPPDTRWDLPSGADTRFYSIVYAVCILLNAFFVLARCFAFMHGGGRAARSLFYDLTWCVLRCPMEFFETTPLGRITNRFSFDTEIVDDLLTQALNGTVASTLWMISAIGLMISVTPFAAILIVPVLIIFFTMHAYYRRTCVDLQRLDSTSRSPIQSHFRQTLDGLPAVRAFGQSVRFLRNNEALVDGNNMAIFAFVSSNRWLGVRLELMGGCVTFAVALSAWFARDAIAPGLVGLAVLWSFNLTTSLNFFVTMSTQAEAKLTSVERVINYANLSQEPALQTVGVAPPSSWPSRGELVFEKVVLRYRESLPPALCEVSFRIAAGEHVGVCGRTGAGKSSMATALFRLRELSSGSISIDGIDLAGLGLSDVRGRALTIIPQDPTLFSGTVRFNVDPFGDFTDAQVQEALASACLASQVRIDEEVGDSGANLSQGQRQLLCLARAILRKPRVLLCDEMTSSVDGVTDALIQQTVRSSFADSTVLTIAHRLHSIMDSSRVMVLEKGRLVEFDSPRNLLKNQEGYFHGLVQANGDEVAEELRAMVLPEGSEENLGNERHEEPADDDSGDKGGSQKP